jgi:hypothetical protein
MWNATTFSVAGSRIKFLESFQQLAIVSVGKYLPGKVGGIIARGSRMTHRGISAQQAAITTLYEQIILLHAAIIVGAAVYAALLPSMFSMLVVILALAGLIIAKRCFRFAMRTVSWCLKKLGKPVMGPDPRILSNRKYLLLTLGYVSIWILSGLILSFLYVAYFTVDLTFSLVALIMGANAIAISAGFFAIFAPGGIGIREGIAATILAVQIPLVDAAVLVVLFRFWTIAMDLLAGMFVLLGGPIIRSGEKSAR